MIASCHRSQKPRQTHLTALIYRAEGGHYSPLGLALPPWDGAGCGSAQFLTLFLILSALAPLPAPFLQDIPVVSTHYTAVDTSSAFQVLAVWHGLSLTYPFCPSNFPSLEVLVA